MTNQLFERRVRAIVNDPGIVQIVGAYLQCKFLLQGGASEGDCYDLLCKIHREFVKSHPVNVPFLTNVEKTFERPAI